MSTAQNATPIFVRLAAFWGLFGVYAASLGLLTASSFMPHWLSKPFNSYTVGMTSLLARGAPYTWFHISAEQMTFVGLIVETVGLLSLLSWPKLAGVLTIALTAHRQWFLRLNADNPQLPNSPLCMFRSSHCFVLDLVHAGVIIAALLVYTSDRPLPELQLKFMKSLGFETRWMDRQIARLRSFLPEKTEQAYIAVQQAATQAAHRAQEAAQQAGATIHQATTAVEPAGGGGGGPHKKNI